MILRAPIILQINWSILFQKNLILNSVLCRLLRIKKETKDHSDRSGCRIVWVCEKLSWFEYRRRDHRIQQREFSLLQSCDVARLYQRCTGMGKADQNANGRRVPVQYSIYRGVSIEQIDKEQKTVLDSKGATHNYDVLIMATGSRAIMLRDIPSLKGIFSMRSRVDADNFKNHIDPSKGKVVIVGGGLLGIELAASLREVNVEVVIIQRISRLMDRQLDILGSELLDEILRDKGIDIYYNDEIERFLGSVTVEGVA
jgi:pyruvate/2-oxoglutarate dehydrogenase complex dihydrolipoamide dehydrogenase (E3) component